MWRVLPLQWLVGYFLFGIALVFLLVWRMQGKPKLLKPGGKGLLRLFGTLWTTVTAFTIVTVLVGKFLWSPLASTKWFSEHVFADVSGDWEGSIQPARGAPEKVEVRIEQDFFELEITFVSGRKRRTDSRTIAVWPERDPSTRQQRLWFVYEARTPNAQPGDTSVHQGAGFIEVRKLKSTQALDGLYWTNRDWQHNAQSAGALRLRRAGTGLPTPPAGTLLPM